MTFYSTDDLEINQLCSSVKNILNSSELKNVIWFFNIAKNRNFTAGANLVNASIMRNRTRLGVYTL